MNFLYSGIGYRLFYFVNILNWESFQPIQKIENWFNSFNNELFGLEIDKRILFVLHN